MNKYIDISGSIGFTLLKNKILKTDVLLLADVHDGVTYCKQSSIQMADYFKNKSYKNKILLEETTLNDVKLKDLWPNSEHTQKLKKLAFKDDKIISFDIRPLLIPFSWELIEIDKKLGDYTLKKYLKYIDTFFTGESNLYRKHISKELDELNNNYYKKRNTLHLKEIERQYNLFKTKNKMNLTLSEIKNSNIEILYKINDIISYIMEWYILLHILNSDKNIIIHTGLAHSSKLISFLLWYKFEKIQSEGINFFNQIDDINNLNNISACIKLPRYIDNMFSKKFGFFSNLD